MNDQIPHWQVWDPLFNQEEAWPAEEFPDATLHYMKEAGCLVTAVATMMRLHGLEMETDPEKYNPWILCQRLKEIRAFDRMADLLMDAVGDLYPVCYLGRTDYTREQLTSCLEDGELCLIQVNGAHDAFHFVVPVRVSGTDVEIIDSGWNHPYLSCFEHAYRIIRFRRSEEMDASARTREAVIHTALRYIGVRESVEDANDVIFNTDYYGREVYGPEYAWCVAFEWDVFRLSGASQLFYDGEKTARCIELYEWAKRTDHLVPPEEGRRGDIALYDWYGQKKPIHTGIILSPLYENRYRTIEGNTSDVSEENACGQVMIQYRRLKGIFAVIRPDY